MNTQQLESFIQVAENLNFARAAEVLNMTQSAVSRQIRSLEEELGTKLFYRSTRSVTLTTSGISFLDDAKEILLKLKLAANKVQDHTRSNIQVLSIGCTNASDLELITPILAQYRKEMPQIHPFLKIIPSRSILNLFIHGEISVLFGFQDSIPERDGILCTELAKIPICCAVPDAHPFAQKTSVSEAELVSEKMIFCISFETPPAITSIQNKLAHKYLSASSSICENQQVAKALIKAGYGLALLPQGLPEEEGLTYIPLEHTPPMSYGVFHKTQSSQPFVKNFISAACSSHIWDELL